MSGFTRDFMMGAATSAHQVEGNNIHSDFWTLEQLPHSMFKEPSLSAADHYNRYEEDIKLLAAAGLNTYRFSIEWARIEPQHGAWVQEEAEHYRKVVRCCHDNGVEPFVTMHHFSSPKWLIENGGWENPQTADYFAAYCGRMAKELGSEITYVCTINEANTGLQIGKLIAEMQKGADGGIQMEMPLPRNMALYMREAGDAFGVDPQNLNIFLSPRTAAGDNVIIESHVKAREAMKAACPHLKIGLSLSLNDLHVMPGGEQNANREWDEEFTHYLPYIRNDDYLGVQSYTRKLIGPQGIEPPAPDSPRTQMGYEDYPPAAANVARKVAQDFKGDIIITENGIATEDDERRIEFIREALDGIQKRIADGIPVKGYLHWSLLDNFEWQLGFAPTFGLVAVERPTQRRRPKKSLAFLGSQV